MKPKNKAPRVSDVIPTQIRIWRKRRGLSADKLADRIAELGGHLSRVTLTKIEIGERRVLVDEALLIAAALNVPPAVLMFPLEEGGMVAITPKSDVDADLAQKWLAGSKPLFPAPPGQGRSAMVEWKTAHLVIELSETPTARSR